MFFTNKDGYIREEDITGEDSTVVGIEADVDTPDGEKEIEEEVTARVITTMVKEFANYVGGEEFLDEMYADENVTMLVEAGRMPKKTFVKMSKDDDLERRISLACLVIAREKKEKDFYDLVKFKEKARIAREKIIKKHRSQAMRIATKSQKQHIKLTKGLKMPKMQF